VDVMSAMAAAARANFFSIVFSPLEHVRPINRQAIECSRQSTRFTLEPSVLVTI